MTPTILVPIDGSALSEQALPTAVSIARHTGAHLHLVRVHEPQATVPYYGVFPVFDAEWDRRVREEEEQRLRSLARRVEEAGVVARAELLEGPVVSTLAEYAIEIDADLVVMTTHGRGGFSRAWLGSVADGLVRRCGRPILLLRPDDEVDGPLDLDRAPALDHILLPMDGSEFSKQVVGRVLAIAKPLRARITLLRVVPTARAFGMDPTMPPPELARARARAAESLDAMAEGLCIHELRVRTAVVADDRPANAIIEYAERHGVGLIAMTTHGRSGLARIVLGSVADKVLRGTSTPLLVYRPDPSRLRSMNGALPRIGRRVDVQDPESAAVAAAGRTGLCAEGH